ncbi:hypothetical protein GGQ74_002394 [Desulfobaculum xiamenense]|uniref:PurE domain-containing protein n=1 Tax=Desulfobaculum xiamenense TaxID=995050 RepID=A0A846QKR8_9BACT|nr:nickel pincer cofactor biosynthesis protein LarB [Desulfobaculum xiamenense]NJB68721.1 hypothetical protein [Desulfobaculum xiamenense]
MNAADILELFGQIAHGALSPEEALESFRGMPVAELCAGVTLDIHRLARTGQGEVIFGPGKTLAQLETCVRGFLDAGQPVLATRLSADKGRALAELFPQGTFHEQSGLFVLGADLGLDGPYPRRASVLVVTAGSSDMGVALEAYGTARFFGLDCGLISDVGVAGVHRLAPHLEALAEAVALIVVAGMDGALPSVLAGLVPAPIIGVPSTSGGGNPMGGVASLMAMLNSCSPGVSVMNIDNGFGAAAFAAKLIASARREGTARV